MRYRFIDAHKKVWPIYLMCQVLKVSRSGYYDWQHRKLNPRQSSNAALDCEIRAIFSEHRGRYGAPRIADELKDRGIVCSENRVARRMQALGLRAIQAKKFKVTTDSNHDKPVADDLLEQDFTASQPNEKWVSDITYVWTDEGWLYLALVMDLCSRRILGWAMATRINQDLTLAALRMAILQGRRPALHHSDRGSESRPA